MYIMDSLDALNNAFERMDVDGVEKALENVNDDVNALMDINEYLETELLKVKEAYEKLKAEVKLFNAGCTTYIRMED